ncbi:unnamed protein product [Didymodactylos carnosus]|uniref:Major facilitator superfamily (MFS) profile domain-containing protein n=1 Tax=Didymodactylos carnosus TaxID=1234261 RepID=A0A815JX37_9BILA|nr:unnamed protein product [Didymodactylos carnosus]CAF1385657.1 unnamed protein product [Didymodactylos carnosus]CAF3920230.1 unnamed protein product [Didymodactylos carnosus]CAF4280716.1 unnamed protein product [Didymodactylos carnosus]
MAENSTDEPFITDTSTADSTQVGCTSWLLMSCIILTMSTAFVFGWGLGAPNQYNVFTEKFLSGSNPCIVKPPDDSLLNLATSTIPDAIVAMGVNVENPMEDITTKIPTRHQIRPRFNFVLELIKGLPQTAFLIGAFIGALTGPHWTSCLDRKKSVYANFVFCFASSIFVILSYYLRYPSFFYTSRVLLGYQGGMACVIVPPYIGEIASQKVRGAAGASFQLSLTIGILMAQITGLPALAGTCRGWGWGLGIVFILPLIATFLLFFVPNSPTQLIRKYGNEEQAKKDLKKLRGTPDVSKDLTTIHAQSNAEGGTKSLSVIAVITTPRYRWPMITAVALQFAQAFSGINAVFFYSSKMFQKAGIPDNLIPVANILTGFINVVATIVALLLMEKVGRKPLILGPMSVMVVVFGILTALVEVNERKNDPTLGWVSVVFVLIFIVCFAIGLGPIPFFYTSEVCRPEARDSIQSLGQVANYLGNILLSLFFPILNSILGGYVFLIFCLLVLSFAIFLYIKMPETKNKSIEENEKHWNITK